MIASADEFIRLRTSSEPAEYLRAATEAAPLEVWLDLITCCADMRGWVAHNKTVPIEILNLLARDPDPAVRFTVAMKNKLSEELFVLLAQDEDDSVRQRIAYNKNVPTPVLIRLAQDRCATIAEAAKSRLSVGDFK